VASNLLGRREAERSEDSEAWSAAASNLVLFLRTFADRWLPERATYNAVARAIPAVHSENPYKRLETLYLRRG
jgi:hypothetical protein